MRIGHFESLKPICPQCKTQRQVVSPLTIANISAQQGDIVIDANLACSNAQCRKRYPVIDGIPIILANLNKYLNDNFYPITVRNDLSWAGESLLGDAAGPASAFNTMRHYLSIYCWDHYADKAPLEQFRHLNQETTSNIARCIKAALQLVNDIPQGPALDIGCAVGRSAFEMAAVSPGPILGIDMNFSLLRTAQRILREGVLSYPLKRVGLVYERHEYGFELKNGSAVDFWACDALNLPFEKHSFQMVSALNVLDAINSPRNLLRSMGEILSRNGYAVFASPYDWCTSTPVDSWIGGHSQLEEGQGASEALLRQMLSPDKQAGSEAGLTIRSEIEHHPWNLRIHDRHTDCYQTHIVACQKR